MPAPSPIQKRAAELSGLVLEIWAQLSREGGMASTRVAEAFRAAGKLSPGAKARVLEDLHGMLRQARRVEFALDSAGVPARSQLRDRARLLAARLLSGRIDAQAALAELPGVEWARVAQVDEAIAREVDPIRRFGLTHSLPDALARELLEAYGAEAEALARSFAAPAPRTLRVNTLKATREAVAAELAAQGLRVRPTEFSPCGLVLEGPGDPFATRAFLEGRIEMQDEASQLVAELAAPAPGSLVVDVCAGAGGKTLALGALMRNKGVLAAIDRHAGRLRELKFRARRAGLFCHRALEADLHAQPWPKALKAMEGMAARVLVDVPCTGTGALRRNPEARGRLDAEEMERLPLEQERLARAAMAFCKPNGRLLYATCSVLPAENERVVERLLADSRFQLVPIAEILGAARGRALADTSGRYLKLLPHRHGTDGFFAAVLRLRK